MKRMILLIIPLILLALIMFSSNRKQMHREVIHSPNAPKAIGPYSQAVRVGDALYLAGQVGLNPKTGKLVGPGFEQQARQALTNLKEIVKTAGFALTDVVQCQVFVKDLKHYGGFNAIYKEFFKSSYPARAVVEVSRIPADALVEIMMVAVRTGKN